MYLLKSHLMEQWTQLWAFLHISKSRQHHVETWPWQSLPSSANPTSAIAYVTLCTLPPSSHSSLRVPSPTHPSHYGGTFARHISQDLDHTRFTLWSP